MDSFLKLIGSYEQNVVTMRIRFVLTLLMLLMYYHYKILLLLLLNCMDFCWERCSILVSQTVLPKKINR